ncbi:MAG TPA: hypothetical protein VML57_07200 [Burkholderiales bacterium]|jgi:translation elongation factor EF-Ts|nr:hypothetical protein [Burkholderiales bacterium]
MKKMLATIGIAAMALCGPALSQPHGDKERKEDILRHRAMAAAHEAAAKCLESGRTEKECLEKLRQDCKGLGIGKYCGMRHKH